MAKW